MPGIGCKLFLLCKRYLSAVLCVRSVTVHMNPMSFPVVFFSGSLAVNKTLLYLKHLT